MSDLNTLLSQAKELSGRATKRPWHIGHMNEWDNDRADIDDSENITIAEDTRDFSFITFSANNLDLLIKIIEVQAKTLEEMEITTSDYRFNDQQLLMHRVEMARATLQTVENLCKGIQG